MRAGGRVRWLWLAVLWLMLSAPAAVAQSGEASPIQSPVLVIDSAAVYAQSAFGRRVQADFEAQSNTIAAENRRIEAELTEEERSLTEQRPTLAPEKFRELADAFDEKVRQIRRTQEAKARAISRQRDEAFNAFLAASAPVLEQMMRESGAAVVLEARSVLLSLSAVDITQAAVARIDAAIGDGQGRP